MGGRGTDSAIVKEQKRQARNEARRVVNKQPKVTEKKQTVKSKKGTGAFATMSNAELTQLREQRDILQKQLNRIQGSTRTSTLQRQKLHERINKLDKRIGDKEK